MPTLTCGSKTDVGRVRKSNQDAFAIVDAAGLGGHADGLYVVADGMGGRAGGDVAARLSVESVPEVVREVLDEEGDPAEAVREALQEANEIVYREAKARAELRGMATTCVVALVRGDVVTVGNVGDSRIYLLRGGEMRALTHDHSLVQEYVGRGEMSREEARGSRFRNVITRGIGLTSSVSPDVEPVTLREGDTLLLCTDGLTGMLEDSQIGRIMAAEPDAQRVCDKLVTAANQHGGRDNTTVVVVRYGAFTPIEIPGGDEDAALDAEPASNGRPERRPRRRGSPINVVLVVLLAAALTAAILLASGLYEVGSAWPFVHKRTGETRTVASPPPPPDLAHVTWGAPRTLSNKRVRGAPLAVDGDGSVYAVSESGKLLRFSPDGGSVFAYPSTVAPAAAPADVHTAVDPHGFVYVASRRERTIARYDAMGTRAGIIQKGLVAPEGMAVDARCDIYVVDGGRIKVLRVGAAAAGPSGSQPVEQGDGAR